MPPDPLDLRRCIGALTLSLSNRIGSGASQEYHQKFGIGVVDWRVLCHLAVEPWSNGIAMAQSIGLDKSVVSRALSGLEERGIVRLRDGARRRREAALTTEGEALLNEILPVARAREAALLSGFSEGEFEQLLGFLHRLGDNLSTIDSPDAPARAPTPARAKAAARPAADDLPAPR